MVECRICKKSFLIISSTHLKYIHGMTIQSYKILFHHSKIGFSITANKLPKTDPRYQRWLSSLKDRPKPWNSGKNKENDMRVRKMSNTLKRKVIDNFSEWRRKMRDLGIIRSTYPPLRKSTDLAFLIGLTLGDGNIHKFPRTERLLISLNSKYPNLVNYSATIMSHLFNTQAKIAKSKNSQCMRVWIYQKYISKRINIPSGNRTGYSKEIPKWILRSRKYLIFFLKGLFEAEGSLSIHLPTYTYNFQFSNKNPTLLKEVKEGLIKLHFSPEVRSDKIGLRKKKEVFQFKKLINFREYTIAG